MRNERDLVDPVSNVSTHAKDARRRTNGTGRLHRVFEGPQVSQPVTLWEQIRSSFTTEELDVSGRAVKGFVVPHWAAGVLLAAFLTAGGAMYKSMSGQMEAQSKTINDQNALLIRLDQRLIDKERHDATEVERMEKRLQNSDALRMVQDREIIALKVKVGLK